MSFLTNQSKNRKFWLHPHGDAFPSTWYYSSSHYSPNNQKIAHPFLYILTMYSLQIINLEMESATNKLEN